MSLHMYQRIISDAFDSRKWNYTSENVSEEKTVFFIDLYYDNLGTIHCEISIYNSGVCDIAVVLPISCPKEQHMELCYYLTKYNRLKRYATLRLDVNSGKIINRYSFVFNQATTPKELLDRFDGTTNFDNAALADVVAICNKNIPLEQQEDTVSSQSINTGKNSKHKLTL